MVTGLTALPAWGRPRRLGLAAAVEAASDHPIAAALLDAAARREAPLATATDVRALPGVGVSGTVDGHTVSVERLADPDLSDELDRDRSRTRTPEGETVVVVTQDDRRSRRRRRWPPRCDPKREPPSTTCATMGLRRPRS